MKSFRFTNNCKLRWVMQIATMRILITLVCALLSLSLLTANAQQSGSTTPIVVQPGAPGQPTRTLPSSTRATLPAPSPKDVEFMQGMIMHHAQAVEMTALINSHTQNKELHTLGARINRSQSDEIDFMRRWLAARGESTSMAMHHMPGMDMSSDSMLMPGMLTEKQMTALRDRKSTRLNS